MVMYKAITADTIDVAEIGWPEFREDKQIKKYVKSFVNKKYDMEINDDIAMLIVFIIDDYC